jgi:hypothetical protein
MNAIETLLAGLIDYAGLYPPAALDMSAAVRSHLNYRAGGRAFALGRFIVDAGRLGELSEAADHAISTMRLSVIAGDASIDAVEAALRQGFLVESIEIKCSEPLTICRICERVPLRIERYIEIPVGAESCPAVDAIASVGACAKLRMGGIVPEAIPPPDQVVQCLQILADRRVRFKATAGLHHPIRARHRLTYAPDSPCARMHGFVNLLCAATLVFSGEAAEAEEVLNEESPAAFRIERDCLAWRTHAWTVEQIRRIRREFFTSFGSCSFVEPIEDLEALGWL